MTNGKKLLMLYKIAILIVTVVIAIKEIKEIADEDNGN